VLDGVISELDETGEMISYSVFSQIQLHTLVLQGAVGRLLNFQSIFLNGVILMSRFGRITDKLQPVT
jgi:hypothetical protein